ncbi:MAG: PAS domain-containing protein [Humidesulfovibrio sp.]|nr:PAS domain-containing protein [Humidesulfovibrio sp.]
MKNPSAQNAIITLVTRLTLLLALVVGFAPALGYWIYTDIRVSTQLKGNLKIQVLALTDFITVQPKTWDVSTDRLLATLDRFAIPENGFRVFDKRNKLLVEVGPKTLSPYIIFSEPLYAFGLPVGRVEGRESFRKELEIGLVIFALGLGCAWLLWVPIRSLPLTALATAERNLRASAHYQRALLDNFPFLVWLRDMDSRYLAVNTKFLEATGQRTDEKLIGETSADLSVSGLAERLRADDRAVLASGQAVRVEEWVEDGGRRCCFEIYKSPVSLDGQIIGTVGYAMDITPRKQNEEKLRETLRMLEETQALIRFGGWEYIVETGSMTWSTEVYRLFGVGPDYNPNDLKRNFSFYTPEFSPRVSTAFWRAVEQGVAYDIDAQLIPLGGAPMWVRTMGTPQRRNGKVTCVRGNIMDITEKKTMELQLQLVNDTLEQRVSDRTQQLASTNREMNQVLSSISAILFVVDTEGRVRKWNQAAMTLLRKPGEDIMGRHILDLPLGLDVGPLGEGLVKCRQDNQLVKIHNLPYKSNEGKEGFLAFSVSPILDEDGRHGGFLLMADDITDLRVLESKLSQAQRLESIGQLAAGIAHEINTPIQYIGDSVTFLRDAFTDLEHVLDISAGLNARGAVAPDEAAHIFADINTSITDIDYAFLKEEIPKSFRRVLEGIDRVSTIVQAMKRFSHPGGGERRAVDINSAVESTLTVAHNEWKYVAELVTDLAPGLPPVVSLPGDLNQVFLNIIVNAAHSINDVVHGTQTKGRITVSTRLDGGMVEIAISDTGTGIPPDVRGRIFNPFFTTKEVGKGTGQGLAIAYDIVVNKHGGTLSFETEMGKGSTFFIRLPVGG